MPAPVRPFLRAAGACVALGLAGAAFAQVPLAKDSPFAPAAGGPAAASATESWELAAVNTIETKTSLYIYDKQAKKGKWVGVGATVDGITVKTYDPARESAVVRIGDQDKTLSLRKASSTPVNPAAGRTNFAPTTANAWAVPPPAATPPPVVLPATNAMPIAATNPPVAAVAPTTPTPPQPPPPTPGSIAHQEQEARMLVSDLLEIGMAQRKAYEEAQKKAALERSQAAPAAK
jgi:hypothetical protein